MYTYMHNRGFSLVEVLVAVSLLMLSVTGPMIILTRTTNSTTFASEQAIAFFLAQEGLELVQKSRDDLVLDAFEYQLDSTGNNDPINDFNVRYAGCIGGNVCGMYIGSSATPGVSTTTCTGSNLGNCQLRTRVGVSTLRPVYVHGGTGSTTPYSRMINITRTPASGAVQEYKVTSTVTWRSGTSLIDQSVKLETYLENTYANN